MSHSSILHRATWLNVLCNEAFHTYFASQRTRPILSMQHMLSSKSIQVIEQPPHFNPPGFRYSSTPPLLSCSAFKPGAGAGERQLALQRVQLQQELVRVHLVLGEAAACCQWHHWYLSLPIWAPSPTLHPTMVQHHSVHIRPRIRTFHHTASADSPQVSARAAPSRIRYQGRGSLRW
jgi:hypothetical protein